MYNIHKNNPTFARDTLTSDESNFHPLSKDNKFRRDEDVWITSLVCRRVLLIAIM